MNQSRQPCTNCDAETSGEFCSACGQRQPAYIDKSVRGLLNAAGAELFSLDSKLWITLKLLLVRPGQLSADFVNGRGKRHLPPMRLFILFGALFVFVGFAVSFNISALLERGTRIDADAVSRITERLNVVAAQRGQTLPELVNGLDDRIEVMLNWLFPATVIPFAALLTLLFRNPGRLFADHFIFAVHFYCFVFIVATAGQLLMALPDVRPELVVGFAFVLDTGYFYAASRRFYHQSGVLLLIKSGLAWLLKSVLKVLTIVGIIVAMLLATI